MASRKIENSLQIGLDALSNIHRGTSELESIVSEHHRLILPRIANYLDDYNKLLGPNFVPDYKNVIEQAIELAGLQSVLECPKLTEVSATDAFNSTFYGGRVNYMQKLSEMTGHIGNFELDRIAGLHDALINSSALHNAEVMGDYERIIQNTMGFPKYDEVSLLNQKLADIAGFEHFNATSTFVEKYLLDMSNQLSNSVNSALPNNVDEILKRHTIGISDIFSNVTVNSAVESARKLLGIHRDSHNHIFDQFQSVLSDKLLNRAVLSAAGLESDYITRIMESSVLGGISSLEQMIKQSTLNAIGWFESYNDDLDTPSIFDALEEIKQSLQDSNKKASIQNYLSILLTILIFLYSLQSNFESEKKDLQRYKELNARVDSLETTVVSQGFIMKNQLSSIEKNLQDIASSNQKDVVEYVVIRPVELRTKSNSSEDSYVISVLQPNQKVELLKRKGMWIYVGYFDYVEDIPKTGWVRKKYLKMI